MHLILDLDLAGVVLVGFVLLSYPVFQLTFKIGFAQFEVFPVCFSGVVSISGVVQLTIFADNSLVKARDLVLEA